MLAAQKLDEYQDLTGQWMTCGPNGAGAGSGAPPIENQPPTTQTTATTAAPPTWNETVGDNANTWTNYTKAGGTQGPTIPSHATVAISCRLTRVPCC